MSSLARGLVSTSLAVKRSLSNLITNHALQSIFQKSILSAPCRLQRILLKLLNLRTPPLTLLFKCSKSNLVDMASQTQLFPITDHISEAKNSMSFHLPRDLTMSHPHHTTQSQMVKLTLKLKQSNSCSRKQNEMEKIPG